MCAYAQSVLTNLKHGQTILVLLLEQKCVQSCVHAKKTTVMSFMRRECESRLHYERVSGGSTSPPEGSRACASCIDNHCWELQIEEGEKETHSTD